MFDQIVFGTILILVSIVIQVLFISLVIHLLTKNGAALARPPFLVKTMISMILVVIWLVVGISLCAWSWAGLFLMLGVFESLEPALYFSTVTFTTLGYGDIIVDSQWRILASFAAVDGLIIFGLNTAFLVEFSSRLRATQAQSGRTGN